LSFAFESETFDAPKESNPPRGEIWFLQALGPKENQAETCLKFPFKLTLLL
jgi:hypothetical protein